MTDLLALLKEAREQLQLACLKLAELTDHPVRCQTVPKLDSAIAELKAAPERKCGTCRHYHELRARLAQMEKDHREDMLNAAAQARHSECFPDEPPGTY